jgi:Na+-transporting NADH:ubiquinone oxidoreductase subunit NqrD
MLYVFVGLLLTMAVVMGVAALALSTGSTNLQRNESARAEHERSKRFFDGR